MLGLSLWNYFVVFLTVLRILVCWQNAFSKGLWYWHGNWHSRQIVWQLFILSWLATLCSLAMWCLCYLWFWVETVSWKYWRNVQRRFWWSPEQWGMLLGSHQGQYSSLIPRSQLWNLGPSRPRVFWVLFPLRDEEELLALTISRFWSNSWKTMTVNPGVLWRKAGSWQFVLGSEIPLCRRLYTREAHSYTLGQRAGRIWDGFAFSFQRANMLLCCVCGKKQR